MPTSDTSSSADLRARDDLVERLREQLSPRSGLEAKKMFGGVCFMLDNRMLIGAFKGGDLLVRVDAARHDELLQEPGAATAVMGPGRSMGPNWMSVTAAAIEADQRLAFWVDVALDFHRRSA